jgi:hypothetical protein
MRSSAEIRHVAEYLGPYRERIRGRCAIVVSTDLHFGLSRMGSAYSEKTWAWTRAFFDPRTRPWTGYGEGRGQTPPTANLSLNDPS